ncbi:aquaporin [Microbacterium marinum]|uniref:aquaporin n=1 Tax=Microbacterium marinum TaxID=421115 RepID=UPI00384C5CEF
MYRRQPARQAAAEFIGTGLLVTVVIGSGIAAQRLSPGDPGLQLLENSMATGLGLAVIILVLGPVSGGHFNPAVSIVDAILARREDGQLSVRGLWLYVVAQMSGGVAGALLASAMFDVAPAFSETERASLGTVIAEVVATAGLVLVIVGLARARRPALTAAAVGAYIAAAYWFTSSTSFANPAVTVARMFTDTFAGIAPASVLPFVLAQLGGAAVGLALALFLFPAATTAVTVPTSDPQELARPTPPSPPSSSSASTTRDAPRWPPATCARWRATASMCSRRAASPARR